MRFQSRPERGDYRLLSRELAGQRFDLRLPRGGDGDQTGAITGKEGLGLRRPAAPICGSPSP